MAFTSPFDASRPLVHVYGSGCAVVEDTGRLQITKHNHLSIKHQLVCGSILEDALCLFFISIACGWAGQCIKTWTDLVLVGFRKGIVDEAWLTRMLLAHSCSLFGTHKNPQNFTYEKLSSTPDHVTNNTEFRCQRKWSTVITNYFYHFKATNHKVGNCRISRDPWKQTRQTRETNNHIWQRWNLNYCKQNIWTL